MSARRGNARHNFWQSLIFWAWLGSFIFGFAGSDLFHTANCPEQLALRASSHGDGFTSAHAPHSQTLQSDIDCPTCLLQLGAQGILAIAIVFLAPFIVVLTFARPRHGHAIARSLITSARGPPVSFI